MTGEAMETLAVLLADISCLNYNSLSKDSLLPGFFLHDSPLEADLGLWACLGKVDSIRAKLEKYNESSDTE